MFVIGSVTEFPGTTRESFFFFPFIFKDVYFTKRYKETPTVIVAANHLSSGGNLKPSHNGITTWVEVKELKVFYIVLFNMTKRHFKEYSY